MTDKAPEWIWAKNLAVISIFVAALLVARTFFPAVVYFIAPLALLGIICFLAGSYVGRKRAALNAKTPTDTGPAGE